MVRMVRCLESLQQRHRRKRSLSMAFNISAPVNGPSSSTSLIISFSIYDFTKVLSFVNVGLITQEELPYNLKLIIVSQAGRSDFVWSTGPFPLYSSRKKATSYHLTWANVFCNAYVLENIGFLLTIVKCDQSVLLTYMQRENRFLDYY